MNPDVLREEIERQVVALVKSKLEDGSMSQERAQQASQIVLETLKPGMTIEELYRAVAKLDDTVQELAPVTIPILTQYEQQIVQPAQKEVANLIRQGQFDAAANRARDVIAQKVKLEWTGTGKP